MTYHGEGDIRRLKLFEWSIIGYLGFKSILICIFCNAIEDWPDLILVNLVGVAVILLISLQKNKARAFRWFRDWYIFLAIPLIFRGLTPLSYMVFGRHFTKTIIELEEAIFGSQPSIWLADLVDNRLITEVFSFFYLSYFLIFLSMAIALYRLPDKYKFEHYKFAVTISFLSNFIIYMFFPVEGPCWVFPEASIETLNGYFITDMVVAVQGQGVTTAAFPSSHVSLAIVALFYAFKYEPKLARFLTFFVVMLIPSTVYGKFHFVIDAITGVLWGYLMAEISWRLFKRYKAIG